MKHLLLIDDDKSVRDSVKCLLHNRFKIVEATNGEIAIQYVNKQPHFDVIITDYMMPIKNGVEVIEWLRLNNYSAIKIIMLTGEVSIKETALNAGADHVLIKPFDVVELETILFAN